MMYHVEMLRMWGQSSRQFLLCFADFIFILRSTISPIVKEAYEICFGCKTRGLEQFMGTSCIMYRMFKTCGQVPFAVPMIQRARRQ
jgi:hypothetical protein